MAYLVNSGQIDVALAPLSGDSYTQMVQTIQTLCDTGFRLYPAAVGMHALVDFTAVVTNHYLGTFAAEAVILMIAIVCAVTAAKLYRKLREEA